MKEIIKQQLWSGLLWIAKNKWHLVMLLFFGTISIIALSSLQGFDINQLPSIENRISCIIKLQLVTLSLVGVLGFYIAVVNTKIIEWWYSNYGIRR